MRSVKYFMASSLDGFISRADGGVDWLFTDQDYGMTRFFASVDVAVMGRKTYDKTQEMRPGQSFSRGMKSFVFSRTRPSGEFSGFTFVSGDIGGWLGSIRESPGKDIWLVGGGELVREFLKDRLVDEIGLTIHARLLGDGVALFPKPYPETELELMHCEQYASGLVQVFYKVKRSLS